MLQRITVILMGILIAYGVAYFGDEIRVWLSTIEFTMSNSSAWGAVLAILVLVVVAIIGLIGLYGSLADIENFDVEYSSAISLICLSLTFGVLASPFTTHGPYPWYWISMWSWILPVAMTPNVLLVAQMIDDQFCEIEKNKPKEPPKHLS